MFVFMQVLLASSTSQMRQQRKWIFRSKYFDILQFYYMFILENILQLIYTNFLITTCLSVALCWNIVIPHTSMYHSKWFKICAALFQFVTQPGTCFCICYSEHNEYAHSYDVVTAHAAELLSELLERRQLWYHVCIHLFQTFLLCRCSTWTVHIW